MPKYKVRLVVCEEMAYEVEAATAEHARTQAVVMFNCRLNGESHTCDGRRVMSVSAEVSKGEPKWTSGKL
jgi:hypothetical protein